MTQTETQYADKAVANATDDADLEVVRKIAVNEYKIKRDKLKKAKGV